MQYDILYDMQPIVLDTSVLVAALRSRTGASYKLVELIGRQAIVPLLTTALFLEYEAVLKRPEQRLAHGLSLADVDRFLSAIASASEPVEVSISWRPQLADADDEMVFEAAVNGRAEALVTHNIRDFVAAAGSFNLRVVKPGEFLLGLKA